MSNKHSGKKKWHCLVGKPRPKSKIRIRNNKEKAAMRRVELHAAIESETGMRFN